MANQRGETTSIGHFYNRCVDAVNNLFDTMSFWTHSKDVEFVDGKTAETKVGAINGITSDISGEADDIAASIKCVNELNASLVSDIYVGDDDKLHKVIGGADTVLNFSSFKLKYSEINSPIRASASKTIHLDFSPKIVLCFPNKITDSTYIDGFKKINVATFSVYINIDGLKLENFSWGNSNTGNSPLVCIKSCTITDNDADFEIYHRTNNSGVYYNFLAFV